jgi:hypothetical protein
MSKKSCSRSVQSIGSRIKEHNAKIADERRKEQPDERLIHYWERELAGLEKSLERARRRLERRG